MGNRDALLQGALRCLRREGYARTTARDVAATAGTSLGAIGYHFGSVEALLNEAIAIGFSEWLERLSPVLERATSRPVSLDGLLRDATDELLRIFRDDRYLVVSLVEALAQAERSPELRAQMAAQYEGFRVQVADIVESVAPADVRSLGIDPTLVGSFLLAVVDGLMIQGLLDPDRLPAPDDLEGLIRAARLFVALVGEPGPGE